MQENTEQRIQDTQELLRKFNIPELYVNDLMALSFLSLLMLDSDKKYNAASSRMMRIHDILKNISDVFNVATDIIYKELTFTQKNSWVYYNQENNLILINSFHPTARKSNVEMYEWMMENVVKG